MRQTTPTVDGSFCIHLVARWLSNLLHGYTTVCDWAGGKRWEAGGKVAALHLPRIWGPSSPKSFSETKDISKGAYTKQTALSQDRRAGVVLAPIVHVVLAWSPCSGPPGHCQPSQALLFFVAAQCTGISMPRSRRSFHEVVACLANPLRSFQHRILPISGARANTTLPTSWIPAIGAHATGSCPWCMPIRHIRHLATHWPNG